MASASLPAITYFSDILSLSESAIQEQLKLAEKEVHKYERCDLLNGKLDTLNKSIRAEEQAVKNEIGKTPASFLARRISALKQKYLEGLLGLCKELNA